MDALATDIFIIFERAFPNGLEFLLRWAHTLVGLTWIGLMFAFVFVQGPALVDATGETRHRATAHLTSRSLWWFHWTAATTFALGVGILLAEKDAGGGTLLLSGDYWTTSVGISIATGMLIGVAMLANVWLVIGPNARRVVANARNVLAGGEEDPRAATAARKVFLASRQNAMFSFPLLFFMIGTSHLVAGGGFELEPGGAQRATYWVVTIAMWLALEMSALGVLPAPVLGRMSWVYEDSRRLIGSGLVLVVVWYVLLAVVF